MAELEKQVEDLRATVMELEKAKKLQGGDSTGSKDGLLNSGGPIPAERDDDYETTQPATITRGTARTTTLPAWSPSP
jgi:hypothetical protein